MKKSLIALLVVLVLIVTVSVFTVGAEGTEKTTAEILAADYSLETGICPHCDELWSELDKVLYTGQTAAGHYYLEETTTLTGISAASGADVVIHLNGNELTGNGSRLVTLYTSGKLYFVDAKDNGGTLSGATSTNTSSTGGVVRVDGGYNGTVYTYNVDIKGAPSWKQGGAVYLTNKSHFYMYGGTISGGSAVDRGGNICVLSNSTATIAGTVTGGSVTGGIYCGGNIYVETGCSLTVEEGALITQGSCTATGSYGGGNIGLRGTGSMIMNGGTISGGSAVKGGNIFCGGSGSVTLNSGSVTGGYSYGTQIGGNICMEDTTALYIAGADISGGYTTSAADTVPVNGTSTSGAGRGGNIAMRGTTTLKMTSGTVSGGNSPSGGNFLFEGTGTNREISGGTVTGGYAGNGGNIYVNSTGCSATVSGTALVTLGVAKSTGGNIYTVGADGKIAVINISGGTISSGTAETTGGVYVGAYSTLNMTEGTVTANESTSSYGGNIRPGAATTTLNISGGTISDGVTVGNGGNLFCNQAAVINITGGTFSGGSSNSVGPNVCFTNAATTSVLKNATISGGTSTVTGSNVGATLYLGGTANFSEISGMTFVGGTTAAVTGTNGGGVLITTGSYTIKNSTFTGGNAYTAGGALQLTTTGTTTLEGCTVSGGIARYGANIYISAGTLNLVDTDINKCGSGTIINGGAIWVGNATVNMDADSTITGSAAMHGGQVCLNDANAVFSLNGGTISGGTASRNNATTTPYGGNVAVLLGTFNMNAGTISGGKLSNTLGAGHGGNVYVGGGAFNLVDGTITGGKASTKENACGGNVYIAGGTFTMTAGTISGGTAQLNGGNIGINSLVADTAAGTLDINGGELTGGTAVTGGSIYIGSLASAVTIDDATISGGKATSTDSGLGGGNIWNALGTTTITDCIISDGVASGAQGGNIYNSGSGLTVTRCTIKGGIAGTKAVDEETGDLSSPTTGNGRGGNLAIAANTTLSNCVIKDGSSYSASGGGGNIYYVGGDNQRIDSCTITGGFAYNNGGNIQHHGATTLYIEGDTYIQGGVSHIAWGGNIATTNASGVLYLQGNTVLDGSSSRCHASAQYGNNLAVSIAGATVYIQGNTVIKNGDNVYESPVVDEATGAKYKRWSVSVVAGSTSAHATINLGGNAQVDKIYLRGNSEATLDGTVVVGSGYTGYSEIYTNYADYNESVVPGADLYGAIVAGDGYANTGTVKALDGGQTGYVAAYNGEKFIIAGYSGFVTNEDGIVVEYGLADLSDVADYEYVKLYLGGDLELTEALNGKPIDFNNQVVSVTTNGYTLAPIDWRTDGGGTAAYTKITVVDDDSKVKQVVTNPTTGYTYLNVQAADGTWTSNCVRVELTKVTIRPSATCTVADHTDTDCKYCGVYYTAKIKANAAAATQLVGYGVVAGLDMDNSYTIDEDFVNNEAEFRWTWRDLNTTKAINEEVRSGMIKNILHTSLTAEANQLRGQYTIEAKAYVTANIGGESVNILSSEEISYTMQQLVEKLDTVYGTLTEDDAATKDHIQNFFTSYYETMSQWTTPNLKAWYLDNAA